MSRAGVELDFFAMAERKNPSIRGIQGEISRISPEILRSVIAGRAATGTITQPLPICNPKFRMVSRSSPETKPLTIFYNGTVVVLDVKEDTAEKIIKLASEEGSGSAGSLELNPHGDLPLARKQSLLRFLERRKERLTATAPYGTAKEVGSPKQKAAMGFEFVPAAPKF